MSTYNILSSIFPQDLIPLIYRLSAGDYLREIRQHWVCPDCECIVREHKHHPSLYVPGEYQCEECYEECVYNMN